MTPAAPSTGPLGPARKAQLVVEVWRTYRAARRAMATAELPAVLERLRAPLRPDEPELPILEGLRLGRAVHRSLHRLPADSRCLMQSLVLTGMLARRGAPSTLVIAVKPGETFAAHAWVELRGQPLLPPMEEQFTRLTDL